MNRILTTILLISLLENSVASTGQSHEKKSLRCVAVFAYQISPKGVFEKFQVSTLHECGDEATTVNVSDAWYKTACAVFSTKKAKPTYKKSRKPKLEWGFYFINPDRPDAVYPNTSSGSSDRDPFVYVRESILEEGSPSDVCNNIVKLKDA